MTNPAEIPLLRVRALHKHFGTLHVLRGLDLEVPRGEVTVVLGGSGTGKSVLMRQIASLDTPDSGSITFDGQELVGLGERELLPFRRRMGMVFQGSALFDSLTVLENVAFPLRQHSDLGTSAIRERAMKLLVALEIDHAARKLPSEISGGMQKRTAIARALALDTELIIYDEPTSGLDPVVSRAVDDLIRKTSEDFNVTSLVVSHDIQSVLRIAQRVAYLHEGRVLFWGPPAAMLKSDAPQLRRYLEAAGV